ncbi:carboxyl-terminal processing protease [Salegentibacter echinorum]|uniref:Carboxyl-terminal processing protease n=2 Tax=Salegentibacter echinorum TaxID=1073325 RepID=A0A1M5E5E4_SALEC|nr:S41 family peptidase [Salegentibacter echinorum]SHF74416.1 carboxyl-terminal processing protease [Salegentibacter echinorum]
MATACAIGVILGGRINFSTSKNLFTSNPKKQKLNRLIDYIDYEYVDDVNTDSIVDLTVNRILENLDPHSVYIPKEEYASVSENMQGDFVGIGVSFYNVNDTVVVIQALKGGPSEKIGIRGGDRILYANGTPLFNMNIPTDSLTRHLKGEINSAVTLKVKRKGTEDLLTFKVKRGRVPLKSVDAAYMLSPTLGYIKVNRFAETTYKEFKKALKRLKKEGATQIALDLRDNPGGYLAEAIKIVDEVLEDEKLILFTKNKSGAVEETYSRREGMLEDGDIYVLINENSASASEVIAGALQDNDRGIIVGRRSYGKGLVQREMELGDGSAVRLTIARYYTPTGRSIQKPYNNGNDNYFKDYMRRYNNGELNNADSIHVNDSLKYTTPKGKTVYGGGGIIPDVFIPKDTDSERAKIQLLMQHGFMNRFVFNVLEEDRSYYNNISREDFKTEVKITEEIVQDFIRFSRMQNISLEVNEHEDLLKRYLKAVMAQQLYGMNAFEKLLNANDPAIEKVLELSKKNQ